MWLNHIGLLLLFYLNHLQPFSTELTKVLSPVPWKTGAKTIWQCWSSACIISITSCGTSHRAELFLMKSPSLSACFHSVLTEGLLTAWVMPGISVSLRKTVKIIKRGKSRKTFGNATLRSSDAADNFQSSCRTLRKKTNQMPKAILYSLICFYLFLGLLASLCNSKVLALFHFKVFCSQNVLLHRIIESPAGQAETLI